jgi:broad specificity phosphatase PhoE
MSMPIDLVLVRHGESDGNKAMNDAKRGDPTLLSSPEFRAIHPAHWQLTERGIAQARTAGDWIKENLSEVFDRYYASSHVRALQTAGYLELPDASWFVEPLLRERERGHEDLVTPDQRDAFQESARLRRLAPLLWRPLNGQSLADLILQLRFLLDTLHRECADGQVIVVCHGETMEAFWVLLERLSEEEHRVWSQSEHPYDRIHNGQVIHWTRRNPNTGKVGPHLGWRRSVCTTDLSLCDPAFKAVRRPRYSNDGLLALAARTAAGRD